MPRRFARTRRRCCGRSMTFTGTRARAGHQPVPAGGVPAGRAGARTSQSHGAVRERAGRPLPAAGARPGAGVGAAVGEVIRRVLAHPAGQAAARSHPAPAQGTGRRRWTCCSGTACRDRHGKRAPAAGAGSADRPQSRAEVLELLTREPFTAGSAHTEKIRCQGLTWLLDWLEEQPGTTWQERWASRSRSRCPGRTHADSPFGRK